MTAPERQWPEALQHDIDAYIEGEKNQVCYLDCLWCELYGSINACQWGGLISQAEADALRREYLFAPEQEETAEPEQEALTLNQ